MPTSRNPGLRRVPNLGGWHSSKAGRQGGEVGALGRIAGETSHGQQAQNGGLRLMAETSWLHQD